MMNAYNNFFSTVDGFGTSTAMIFGPLAIIAGFIFWLWLLIDCSRRKFSNNYEKVAWIVFMCLGSLAPIGLIAYLVVIKLNNKQGILTA